MHAEDIDKANDLHKLGGMEPLYKLLAMKVPPAVTQLALHTLGSAASHNQQVAVLHPAELLRLYCEGASAAAVGWSDGSAAAVAAAAASSRGARTGKSTPDNACIVV